MASDNQLAVETELKLLFSLTKMAYSHFMSNGKTYLYASRLLDYNTRLRNSLYENAALFPESLQEHIAALVFHIDVWKTCFEEHYRDTQPSNSSVFDFPNDVNYPRDAEEAILAACGASISR